MLEMFRMWNAPQHFFILPPYLCTTIMFNTLCFCVGSFYFLRCDSAEYWISSRAENVLEFLILLLLCANAWITPSTIPNLSLPSIKKEFCNSSLWEIKTRESLQLREQRGLHRIPRPIRATSETLCQGWKTKGNLHTQNNLAILG